MKIVLLDRDGILNEDRADYVKNPKELVLVPGVGEAVARLNDAGLKVAIVSNQSAVGRGIISMSMLEQINEKLLTELRRARARIDLFLICTDAPGHSSTLWSSLPWRGPWPSRSGSPPGSSRR